MQPNSRLPRRWIQRRRSITEDMVLNILQGIRPHHAADETVTCFATVLRRAFNTFRFSSRSTTATVNAGLIRSDSRRGV